MEPHGHPWFHDTVSAIAYSLAGGLGAPPFNDLTRFILAQHAQMPDYLRFPVQVATGLFDLSGIPRTGHCFHSRGAAIRSAQVRAWQESSLGFKRDLVRYYQSLAMLALYSRSGHPSGDGFPSPTRTASPEPEMRCEVAVVGSGPGGALTACLLAESGRKVLLLEEGPFFAPDSCEAFSKTEMLLKYRNGGQTFALGRNKIPYVEGRCVGGGSEINSGLYHRTPPEILDQWRREFHVDGMSDGELLPHFEACERELSVSPLDGPPPSASARLRDGAARMGWKCVEVPRWFRYDPSSGLAGQRQTMTRTFIPRFMAAGGTLLPETRVEKVRFEGGKWLLHAQHADSRRVAVTADTLFVAAGAVQTPALLRRSGITANIGNTLHLHPTVKVVARFPQPVNSEAMGVPVHQVKEFAPGLTFGCSISSRPYLALGLLESPGSLAVLNERWRFMANYYAMVSGEGHGTVRTLPVFKDPLVRYRLPENDRRQLATGLRKLAEVLLEAGAEALYPGLPGAPEVGSRAGLNSLPAIIPVGVSSLMTIHLFASCPMGEDKSRCATDSFGRVHGFRNLHIADASLLCTAPGVNPQGTIMALARRNALRFLS